MHKKSNFNSLCTPSHMSFPTGYPVGVEDTHNKLACKIKNSGRHQSLNFEGFYPTYFRSVFLCFLFIFVFLSVFISIFLILSLSFLPPLYSNHCTFFQSIVLCIKIKKLNCLKDLTRGNNWEKS